MQRVLFLRLFGDLARRGTLGGRWRAARLFLHFSVLGGAEVLTKHMSSSLPKYASFSPNVNLKVSSR